MSDGTYENESLEQNAHGMDLVYARDELLSAAQADCEWWKCKCATCRRRDAAVKAYQELRRG